jgi:BASS family bile acid:Na+ symporter
VAGGALGLLVPSVAFALKPTIPVWLSILMFFSAFQIRRPKLPTSSATPILLLVSLAVIHILTPGGMFILAKVLGLSEAFLVGLVLVAAAPSVVSSPYLTKLMNGDVDIAFAITVLSTALSPLAVPLMALLLVGMEVTVNMLAVARIMLVIIFVPVLLALFVRSAAPKLTAQLLAWEDAFTFSAILLNNWIIIGVNREFLASPFASEIRVLLLLAFVQGFGLFFFTRWVSRLLVTDDVAKALAVSFGIKNAVLIGAAVVNVMISLSLASAVVSLVSIPMFIMIVLRREDTEPGRQTAQTHLPGS